MNGQQLVNDYQTAMVTAATAEAARYAADESEGSLLGHLEDISSGRFLNPGAIDPEAQADITRASLDAHFKKVQAQQMQSMSGVQLDQLVVRDQQLYQGRKVRVTVRGRERGVIELISFDPHRGYRSSVVGKRSVVGIVETVALDRNVLVLRPTLGMRLLNSQLQNYVVYVIDPESFSALVELSIV